MKARFQIAERSLSYAKIVPTRAMKARFQIAERSLSYAKIKQIDRTTKFLGVFLMPVTDKPQSFY
ncbi:hypothetical protein [Segatella buccae]|uniref:hypothetical protein n=1 Tax=Segatella buccae TaxID=28126 RepID=UPI00248E34DE|nr:hypothetical protein [Segatella buccae]